MNKITVTPNSTDSITQRMYSIFYTSYRQELNNSWIYKDEERKAEFLNQLGKSFEELFSLSSVQIEVEYFDTPGDEREDLNKFYLSYE